MKFKNGDRVHHRIYGNGIVISYPHNGSVRVKFWGRATAFLVDLRSLEKVRQASSLVKNEPTSSKWKFKAHKGQVDYASIAEEVKPDRLLVVESDNLVIIGVHKRILSKATFFRMELPTAGSFLLYDFSNCSIYALIIDSPSQKAIVGDYIRWANKVHQAKWPESLKAEVYQAREVILK